MFLLCKNDLRNDVALFGQLYIANQLRDGDPSVFFCHENQLYPPSLSSHGKLRPVKKSDLVKCLFDPCVTEQAEEFDCKVFDGAVLVHILKPTAAVTFQDYADNVFLPFLSRELEKVSRIDVVWDRYFPNSIKGSARAKRGAGVRRKVSSNTKIPGRWLDFLRDSRNKVELFSFLTQPVSNHSFPEKKLIYITEEESVISVGGSSATKPACTHEEADTRVIIHLLHAAATGHKKIVIRTVDTDILIILIGQFHLIRDQYEDIDVSVAFGTGKDYIIHNINNVCSKLGKDVSQSLPTFHAFSGCDSTSGFHGKGKKSAWEAWKAFPEVTSAFLHNYEHPFDQFDSSSWQFQLLERFTVILYDRTSTCKLVNKARRELFCKKSRSLENLPPTQDALLQHVKRVVYQAGIWISSRQAEPEILSPGQWGWEDLDGQWQPLWMTLSEAAKACTELIKCACTKKCKICKYIKSGLPCTELCRCTCQK